MVRIVGQVGAGDVGHFYNEQEGDLGETEAPENVSDKTVAVQVRGYSMEGIADDGSILFYDEEPTQPHSGMIGKLCVVGLTDGRVLFKKLVPGSEPGRWNLISVNGGSILNASVEWAVRIKHITLS